MQYSVPEKISTLANIFRSNGFSLYLVGGAVRDYVLGKQNHDYDFTTDAEPLDVKKMFRRTIDTGIKHGTVTVLFKGESYEITTFRTEGEYKDKRHPENVSFVKNLDEDLKRRDFTINALAVNLSNGEIIDYHEGLQDLDKHIIRAIGNPEERFEEDALRMLRACRFASKLDFDIEKETLDAITKLHSNVLAVSEERIKEELFKMIDGRNPIKGLEAMRVTGLMEDILPELSKCYGVEQDGFHNEDVYTHLMLALSRANEMNYPIEVKVASLFHDIGKPDTKQEGKEHFTYFGHEFVSEEKAKNILNRLKASNQEKKDILTLVRNHMFSYTPDWTNAAVRRFINRVGIEYIERLFMVRDADLSATTGPCPDGRESLKELRARIDAELKSNNALTLKNLHVNGNDLKSIGITNGKLIGKTLSELLERVIENPTLNEKEKLLELASSLFLSQEQ